MALLISKLELELSKIIDSNSLNFGGYPDNIIESADRFGSALKSYSEDVIPFSSTLELSKQNFVSIFSMSNLQNQNGILQLQLAIQAFALQLSIGMSPTFSSTPPSLPINLTEVVQLGMSRAEASIIVVKLSQIIDSWMRTGIAVNNNTGLTINWS